MTKACLIVMPVLMLAGLSGLPARASATGPPTVDHIVYAYSAPVGGGRVGGLLDLRADGGGRFVTDTRTPDQTGISPWNLPLISPGPDTVVCSATAAEFGALAERVGAAGLLRDRLDYPGYRTVVLPGEALCIGRTLFLKALGAGPPADAWWMSRPLVVTVAGHDYAAPPYPLVTLTLEGPRLRRVVTFALFRDEVPAALADLSYACQEFAEHCRPVVGNAASGR